MNDPLVIDTSAWVEFFLGTALGKRLRSLLSEEDIYMPLPTLSEVYYILCRIRSKTFAASTVDQLVQSKVNVTTSISLGIEMGKIKCKRTISLADAGVIALACLKNGKAVFKKKEREIQEEMDEDPFRISFIFLENLK